MTQNAKLQSEGMNRATQLLKNATTTDGILASVQEKDNYRRIWARDGIICGLAGLLAEDEMLTEGLKATLTTLANHQGPEGQIPSNVKIDKESETSSVSYGGLVGRVDPTLWFIIGVCNYLNYVKDKSFQKSMEKAVRRCLVLLDAWEFNGRGLLYVPQGGDWADEFILSGYVLYDQLLRLWAFRCLEKIYHIENVRKKAESLLTLIRNNYWPDHNMQEKSNIIHPAAYKNLLKEHQKTPYWLATLHPGGYTVIFDCFSNALALILAASDENQTEQVVQYGEMLRKETAVNLLPAFWPPVKNKDPLWPQLRSSYGFQFKNRPYEYHNGGVWPIINAWWGMALIKAGRSELAQQIHSGIIQLNYVDDQNNSDWAFYEYFHALTGHPGGTRYLSWSAAGSILLKAALDGKHLFYG